RHPRVAGAFVVAAVAGVAADAPAERRVHRVLPGTPAVGGPARDEPVGTAVGPAVLLPHPDEGAAARRGRGEVRLHLGVQVVGAALRRPVAAGPERRRPAGPERPPD